MLLLSFCVFFFKQKTAYEMRISDWSSDVCSSDLDIAFPARHHVIIMERPAVDRAPRPPLIFDDKLLAFEKIARAEGAVAVEGAEYQIGRASCRERVCKYV